MTIAETTRGAGPAEGPAAGPAAAALLGQLRQRGIELWVESGELRFRGPAGVLDDGLRASVVAAKPALIALLEDAAVHAVRLPQVRRAARAGATAPLSAAQRRFWFLDQATPGNPAFNLPYVVRLTGRLDRDALREAVAAVVHRHESLRTTFPDTPGAPGEPMQLVAPPGGAGPELPVLDLAGSPQSAVREQIDAEFRQGFDLVHGPLLRTRLVRLADEEHLFLLTVHHIVFDGWSFAVFLEELAEAYRAGARGLPVDRQPQALQYRDYAQWQQGWLDGPVMDAGLDAWRPQLDRLPSPLELPADRPRPPRQSYAGAALPVTVPADLTAQLTRLARQEGATPFMVLLAGYAALLGRLSGQPDLLVGAPVAGRPAPELEALIGFFVNMLPLRVDLTGEPSFRDLLRRVRATTLAAYGAQHVPFERLVEEFAGNRDVSRPPLFSTMFALQTMPTARVGLPGLELAPVFGPTGVAKYDLSLVLVPVQDRFEGALEYNTDLFDAATAEGFAARFGLLLRAAVTDPDALVDDLPLLDAAEHQRLVVTENATGAWVPDLRLAELLAEGASGREQAIAVEAGDATLTHAQLHRQAGLVAARLNALGAGPGTVVGVLGARSAAVVTALIGVLKAGAGYLPLDPTYPAERLAFLLADSGASILLRAAGSDVPAGYRGTVVDLDLELELGPGNWSSVGEPLRLPRPGPEDVAYLIYTSGSTGRPKGVRVPHRAVVNFLTSMLREPGLTADDTVLSVISFSFDFSVLELFLPLAGGARLVLATADEVADGRRLAGRIATSGATWMAATPTTWRLLIEAGWSGDPGLTACTGGEPLPSDLARELLPRTGSLWNLYGPTETTVFSTLDRIQDAVRITVGRPIANTQVHVLDPRGRPQPVGVAGEICIGGTGVALGYHDRAELTAERFVPDPFVPDPFVPDRWVPDRLVPGQVAPASGLMYRTGDVGRRLADGRIECLGRLDDQVKVRGHRIEVGEVARVLEEHPQVTQAVVVLRPDRVGDPQLTAYVTGSCSPHDLRVHARNLLPGYLVPAVVVPLPALPLTPNGKIDKSALPAPPAPVAEHGAPGGPVTVTEGRVMAAWCEVLGLPQVNLDDDFFDLGGESMKAVRVIRRLDPELPVLDLFARPTVRALAAHLDERQAVRADAGRDPHGPAPAGDRPLLVTLRPARRPASIVLVCVPFGGGGAVSFDPMARCAPDDWEVRAVELPGHDFARRDEVLLPLAEVARRCVAEILADRSLTADVVVYGHCVGSALAVALARELERVGRPVRGVVVGAGFPATTLPGVLGRFAALSPARRQNSRAVQDSLRVLGGLGENLPRQERELLARNLRHDAHEAEEYFGRAGGPGTTGHEQRLAAPLLAVSGGADRITEFAAERVEDWTALATDVRLAVLPGAEHFFVRECPADLVQLIAAWLAGAPVGSAVVAHAVPVATRLRWFVVMVIGQLISMIGTGVSTFALGVWAYRSTGSVTAFAGIAAVAVIPAVVLAPLAGAVADRIDRRRVMIACDVGGLLTAGVLLALLVTGRLQVWHLYVVAAAAAAAGAFRQPAYLAGATQLVPKRYLGSASGLLQLGTAGGTIASQLLGGVLLAALGLRGAAMVDVVSFAVALATLVAVRFPDTLFARRPEPLGHEIVEGARFLLRRPPLLAITLFFTLANALGGLLVVLVTPLLLAVASTAALGTALGMQGLGLLAGGVLMAVWGGARLRSHGMLLAVAVFAASSALIGLAPTPGPVALGMAGVGVCAALANAHWLALVQVKVPVTMQGRVVSSCLMLARTAMPLAYLAAGPTVAAAGGSTRAIAAVVVGTGVLAFLLTIAGALFPPIRDADDLLPDAVLDPRSALTPVAG